ncbi:unnamed protein product, partial [Adineta steineri]
QQYIALQFICDGHPGDCPDNLDENEVTCTAAKCPAKENIEKVLHAVYTFLFASAFSVSKNIHSFAKKTFMSSEDIPLFAQETVNQGLAALVEKLYDSGFMD